jgi:hypothetical protein
MNFIRKAVVLLAVAFALAPATGFAQYVYQVDPLLSYFSNAQRYEIGGGLILPSGEFTGPTRVLNSGGVQIGDSTAKRPISTMGFGGQIGLNLPFKGTGHISCWALAIQLQVNVYTWKDLNQTMTTDGTFKPYATSLDAGTMQVSLPIGIDYKVGNDAILSKRLAFGASMGVGVIPQFNSTSLSSGSSSYGNSYGWGFTPYAKFDWSIMAGLCWKLRFMYTLGKVNILDVNGKVLPGLNDGPLTLSAHNAIMASLIVMPFSGRWEESAWYNTYDTYNLHDRFN